MSDLDLLRQNVRDQEDPPQFPDEILAGLLARYSGDVNLASAHVWVLRAGDASLRNFRFNVDGRSVDKSMTAQECREQSAMFRQLGAGTGEEIVEVDWTNVFDV